MKRTVSLHMFRSVTSGTREETVDGVTISPGCYIFKYLLMGRLTRSVKSLECVPVEQNSGLQNELALHTEMICSLL